MNRNFAVPDKNVAASRGFLSLWTRLPLWKQIFFALILGLSLGIFLNQTGRSDLAADIKPIGDLFIRGIKMLIVPLVFISLVTGVASLDNLAKIGRLSIKTLLLYLGMTAIAITIGLGLGIVFQPGVGIDLGNTATVEAPLPPSVAETILGLVPTNAVQAFAEGNVLQIIVFAILFGLCITLVGEKARPVKEFFESLAEIIYRMTSIVIACTPYGVFALMTWVAGTYGLDMLLPLAKVIAIVYFGCFLHAILVYGGMLHFGSRLNPIRYFQGSIEPIMLAFTSTSSSGTLPITMMAAEKNLGVKRGVSSFVLPLGATINMDGTALYQGVCALFIAQAYGIDLSTAEYATIILTATLGSIGTAGVPGAGLIMLSLVLTSVGLPLEGVAIIAGIDRVLDMARTGLNVAGDCAVSCIVAKSEGELNEDIYNTPHVLKASHN